MVSVAVMAMAVVLLTSGNKKPISLYFCGDSTCADKTELEISPERGWGQLFPSYLDEQVIVKNHAMNGRSTKSFITEGRWQCVLDDMHRGDIVVLQFGHNDSKKEDPKRYASIEDYEKNLMKMTEEAQKKGAKVIICTPISRRYFKNDEFRPRHGGYPEAARRAAKAMQVPMVDMENMTADWLIQLGDSASRQYFMNVAPGECIKFPEGKTDNTHLKENGAMVVGEMFAKAVVAQKIKPLSKHIVLGDSLQPKYTEFCRPNFSSDKTVKQESDMKSFKE